MEKGNNRSPEIQMAPVAKDDHLFQSCQRSLGLTEYKAILYLASKIQPDDQPGKSYIFDCKEFLSLINWNSRASYYNIKVMLQNLASKSLWLDTIIDNHQMTVLARWLNIVRYHKNSGEIEVQFHSTISPFLQDLRIVATTPGKIINDTTSDCLTTCRLQEIAHMTHRYSPRLYELLRNYQLNNKPWRFDFGTGTESDLQQLLADIVTDKETRMAITRIPAGWHNFAAFKRNILDPAVKEINEFTGMKVAYTGIKEDLNHKKTKAVRTIKFHPLHQPVPGKQKNFHNPAEKEMATGDRIPRAESLTNTMERKNEPIYEAIMKESLHDTELHQFNKTTHPLLSAELNEDRRAYMTEDKVSQLFDAAVTDRVAGIISYPLWESFAADLVTYYYDEFSKVVSDSKMIPYQQLLECVKNDPDKRCHTLWKRYR